MNHLRFAFTWLVLLSLLSLPGRAATPRLDYLSADALPIDTVVSAFPDPNSAEQQTDMSQVLAYQSSRTSDDCKRANTEASISLNSFFGPAYGPLTKAEVTQWKTFFNKVLVDADYFAEATKDYWQRPRPFSENSQVQPCIPKPSGYSYPSGHATISGVWARVLAKLDPSRAQAFMDRADQIALDRVMGGVHYPTDIAAGKALAEQVAEKLFANSDFQTDFDAAKP